MHSNPISVSCNSSITIEVLLNFSVEANIKEGSTCDKPIHFTVSWETNLLSYTKVLDNLRKHVFTGILFTGRSF